MQKREHLRLGVHTERTRLAQREQGQTCGPKNDQVRITMLTPRSLRLQASPISGPARYE
jgi:hypothetical protein